MKIAIVQMRIEERNKKRNVEHGLALLEKAAAGNDVVVMPEVWTTGYSLGRLQQEAEELDGPVISAIRKIALEACCAIIPAQYP
jgi:predicted amidohydrolase